MSKLRNTRPRRLTAFGFAALLPAALCLISVAALANPERWAREWPDTDFSQASVVFDEILSGGPPKDGIPSIDQPQFVDVAKVTDLSASEPVVGLSINGDARAYPLRILTWHEIVNDTVGGVAVAVTYCPLCNSAVVFERSVEGEVTEFGTTGKLRNSDLVMYDRKSESWWQQFLGEAIVGERTGTRLKIVPARLESWSRFAARFPDGRVLIPNNPGLRPYGANPYVGYDTLDRPFLYNGEMPVGIAPMKRVIAVGAEAWALDLLREKGKIESGDLLLTWEPGQNSALDTRSIAEGREVGNVVVQRKAGDGTVDVPYDVTFAFVFHAFRPEGTIHQ
ncbi:DUF3179 domain-containing protein [Pelagibius litoralis]|uniref:DUF3179 domain-containing protein n=1 Tax=Pelagibius litoralis TaxID=374515 RepID=A0A967EZL7_9PROT|nr:DUF3179 domain-containing protein [Pelagibius litoralis]NIA70398.1 DUF3179 domain-containing protein [Pelagibius litoralis]